VNSKWMMVIVVGLFLVSAGCETAKGFQKDVSGLWGNAKKLDDWWKENLW